MDKKTLLALFIIVAFLTIYSRFLPQKPNSKRVASENVKVLEQEEITPSVSSKLVDGDFLPADIADDVFEAEIEDYIIMYSPVGGYIKNISLGTPENILPFQNIGFVSQKKGINYRAVVNNDRIRFSDLDGNWKEFVFSGNVIEINASGSLSKPILIFSNELDTNAADQRYQEIFWSKEDAIKRLAAKKVKSQEYTDIDFAGARDRYYCLSLLKGNYDIKWVGNNKIGYLYLMSPPPSILLYIGPQSEKALKPFELQSVMNYGFFHVIGMVMIKILYFLHLITKSWGLSIILFAIIIYAILFPFTIKSTKAMKKMQLVQPEIEKIKTKYKDNPQKVQKETMETYRKYKINPIGGCLPLFFQFPVFIALYQVLFRFVELKGAHFLWISDLSNPDHLFRLSFYPHYINLLPILIMVIGILQQKVTTTSSMAPEQKKMGLFFGVLLGVIFYNFPAALTLYWLVQNLLTFGYQVYVSKAQPSLESLK